MWTERPVLSAGHVELSYNRRSIAKRLSRSIGDEVMKTKWQILVVDDEEVMRESLAAWLGEDGYAVDTAESGKQAMDLARISDYAIYFIDLKMPGGMDGIETMMEIRRIHKDAPVVIVTAY